MAELHVPPLQAEPVIHLGGFTVTNSILLTWVAMMILFALLYLAVRRPKLVPSGAQNAVEMVFEGFRGLVLGVMEDEKRTDRFLPLVLAIFFFVLVVNWVSLIPGVGTVGGYENGEFVPLLRAGSSDLNLTLALAAVSFLVAQVVGILTIGVFKYGGKFINFHTLFKKPFHIKNVFLFVPNFLLGLIELISELAKLVSLSFRLFGNVLAGEVLLVVFGILLPLFIPLSSPFYILEVFVGLIQAFVFAMLTIVFIRIAALDPEH